VSRLYVDVHVLQTVPPSNLNRDDAGSPKQAVYGGVRRARVSSQSWKRATRKGFAQRDGGGDVPLGTRTKRLRQMLEERFTASGATLETAEEWSKAALEALKLKDEGKGKKTTQYLLFFGLEQVDRLAELVSSELAAGRPLDDKQVQAVLSAGHPVDVALFGRMVADLGSLNVDAATQVAHALSTHAVDLEFDYFTAVDDQNEAGETGAGMIGTVEFTSATLYRFATVGVHQLRDNLDGDTDAATAALRSFLRSFALSMPTGHENSFGHHTRPDLVTLVVRDDQPVNLVSAFEDPVPAPGIVDTSVRRLASELDRGRLWGDAPRLVVSTWAPRDGVTPELPALGELVSLNEAITRVLTAVHDSDVLATP
jgi:CRISPR system Cascade subunit CasC